MTPWATLKSFFAAIFRGEDPQRQQRWFTPYMVAGVPLTSDQSLSLATVWACIDIISKSLAAQKWNIYQPVPGTNRRTLCDDDWRTWMLNTRPNDDMTAIGFREAMLFQAIPYGNAYAEIVPDAGGRVRQLWPLMSDRMMPRRNRQTWKLEYHYTQPDGSTEIFTPRSIFHLRGPGLWGLMGDNLIARAAKTLGLAAAQERFSASFFGQGAQPMGVLEFPGKITDDIHKRLKEEWSAKYKGPENAHKPLILEGGMKFNAISTEPAKAQLTEGKQFSVEEICRWFGVPPHKVQHLLHATFSNIEHSSIEFVRDSCSPWERRLCQEADFKLFDQNRGPFRCTEIDLRPLLRGDAASRAEAQSKWRQNGIMTANEIRQQEGLDDCGADGDVLLVPVNLTTVERLVAGDSFGKTTVNPALDPTVDDDGVEIVDGGPVDEPKQFAARAVVAALDGALARYGRRLHNRAVALANKTDAETQLNQFRAEQHKVLLAEMVYFNFIVAAVIGRELTLLDMAKAAQMYERGERLVDFVQQLPTSTA